MQLLKKSKEKFVHDGETLRSRTICKKNRGGVREWIRWLCTENKPLFLLGAGETETAEMEIVGVGQEESDAPGHQEQQTEKGSNGRCLPNNQKVKSSHQGNC